MTSMGNSSGTPARVEARSSLRRLIVLPVSTFLAVALLATAMASGAEAAGASPHWTIQTVARPSNFTATEEEPNYELIITNNGAAATNPEEPIVIHDTVTSAIRPSMEARDWNNHRRLTCSEEALNEEELECEMEAGESLPSGGSIAAKVILAGVTGSGPVTNVVTVTGGGTATATRRTETPISSEQAPFALEPESFSFAATGVGGELVTQAGAHPFAVSTNFELERDSIEPSVEERYRPAKNPRTVSVTLPAGFFGNPLATPRCPVGALAHSEEGPNEESIDPCPSGSIIGEVVISKGELGSAEGTVEKIGDLAPTPIYNIVPEPGHAAEFGFTDKQQYPVVFYADLVKTDGEYRVRVSAPGVPVLGILGANVMLFGNPGARNGERGATTAFLGNPAACQNGPLDAHLEIDSWEEPNSWVSADTHAYPNIEGCDLLNFSPELAVTPEQSPTSPTPQVVQADSPNGYEVTIKVPRAESPWATLASPEIKDATVTFPPGLSVSPSSANGLEGCEATGARGIDMPQGTAHPNEAGEGEAIAADGLSYLTKGNCPARSKIGQVEVLTPLLEHPLAGSLFLAEPGCGVGGAPCTEAQAEDGEMVSIYLEAEGSGVNVKLKGSVELGGHGAHSAAVGLQPGQIRTRFLENPQLPVSEIKIRLNGGPRAPLASPQTCGEATTTSEIEPWSGVEALASPTASFDVIGCPASEPFSPAFTAGTAVPAAGGSSPFTVTLSRRDGEQNLYGVSVTTPPGVAATLASVPRCEEPQAAKSECSPQSIIGHDHVAAGPGSDPYWVEGTVYLTGPYKGAPFGLLIVTPAKAGPFNLGDVATRAALRVNEFTAAATVESDPLPQILDGVPLRVKTVVVTLDRPGFMIAPTNCSQLAVTGSVTGALPSGSPASTASVSTPYAVTGCKALAFSPSFTASTAGKTRRGQGASLKVKIAYPAGSQANLHKVDVVVPRVLPTQDTTLKEACTEAQFNINPAGCPAHSDVASVVVHTPILASPLTGPAYLVSHGNAAFPDVELVLQGEGVELIVDGKTQIKKGLTYSHFETVPDAPISSFEFNAPKGPHALFAAFGNLCRKRLLMPVVMTGQNGAVVDQETRIQVEGCSKSLALISAKAAKKALTVSVYAPAAGKVTASAAGLKTVTKAYTGNEVQSLTLRRKKSGATTTKLHLSFVPVKGKRQVRAMTERLEG